MPNDKLIEIVIVAVITLVIQGFGSWVARSTAPLAKTLTTKIIKKITTPLFFDFILQSIAFIGLSYLFYTYGSSKAVATISDVRTMILLGILIISSFLDFRRATRNLIFKEKH